MTSRRHRYALFPLLLSLSCASSTTQSPPAAQPCGAQPATPRPAPQPCAPAAAGANRVAELLRRDLPEAVQAGTTVSFGLDVGDEEFDRVRVAPEQLPEGATFDPRTLTVRWQVPASLAGRDVELRVRVTEERAGGATHGELHTLRIRVQTQAPAAPAGLAAEPLVHSLVTITLPEALEPVGRAFGMERLLELARDAAIDALPAERQAAVERRAPAELFRDLLTEYARTQQNPRLDPASPSFDHRFDAARWRLVAVRPRLNKHVQELRLAFQAVEAPEPVFAMFRFRLFRGPWPASPAQVEANNRAFTRLYHQAFFEGAQVRPAVAQRRPAEFGAALLGFVRSVLEFRDPTDATLRAGLVAIPLEARMGGGSTFDAQGAYQHGNGWAWAVGNVRVVEPPAGSTGGHPAARVTLVPISSFTFDLAPSADGSAYTSVCPPRFSGASAAPELRALCERDGTVRIPEQDAQGHTAAIRRDSMEEHHEVTMEELVARIPLRDARRRNFEENGMTCAQCHLRNFDDGVLTERQVEDPRVPGARTAMRPVARVPFQVLPVRGVPRSPWYLQQETGALCDLNRSLDRYAGVHVSLPCPADY